MFVVVFCFLFLSVSLLLNRLMMVLLILEMMSLWVFFTMFMGVWVCTDFTFLFSYLVVVSSESVLGLVLFVMMTKHMGKDYLVSMNMLKF